MALSAGVRVLGDEPDKLKAVVSLRRPIAFMARQGSPRPHPIDDPAMVVRGAQWQSLDVRHYE